MRKILLVLFFFYLFLFVSCSPYRTIRINTRKGLEVDIPASCTSWSDGCSLACRTGPVEYIEIPIGRRCIQANIIYPKCVDNNPVAVQECEKMGQSTPDKDDYIDNIDISNDLQS